MTRVDHEISNEEEKRYHDQPSQSENYPAAMPARRPALSASLCLEVETSGTGVGWWVVGPEGNIQPEYYSFSWETSRSTFNI